MKRVLLLLLTLLTTSIYSKTIKHRVENGETLFGLSVKYNISYTRIIEDNNLETTSLKIGQELVIESDEPDKYRVEDGDTLSGIAANHDITLKHLLLVNRIDIDYPLKPGEILTLPTTPELKKEYTVEKGDTLSWISMTYNIDIDDLKRINSIDDSNLRIGETLSLIDNNTINNNIPSVKDENREIKIASAAVNLLDNQSSIIEKGEKYRVKSGDTLSAIALEYQTSISDLITLNNINGNQIRIDQELILPFYAKKREPIDYDVYHKVIKGETISGIALEYDISETLLKEINNLDNDNIYIGQMIKLIPSEKRTHEVAEGETLWSIARKYNVSVDQLMQYNNLNSTIVQIGRTLTLYDYSVAKHIEPKETLNLVSFQYKHNTTKSQPYKNFEINELINPLDKYNQAKDNWKEFSALLKKETPISDDLNGWTVILDPGHGGKDPGAIATVTLNGKNCYIVEDEYAYDTAVRLYELLERNGANVYMTILSPDHITRNPLSNTTTFINEKNEVYNNYALNKINNSTVWPVGGQWGLDQRVKITNNIISSMNSKKTIFISIHADNDVDRGIGKLVLFNNRNGSEDKVSKNFANTLVSAFGENASCDGMALAVLHNNNADLKVLIELRNMAHLSEAMALLDNKKRQEDAQMILDGIKSYTLLK